MLSHGIAEEEMNGRESRERRKGRKGGLNSIEGGAGRA